MAKFKKGDYVVGLEGGEYVYTTKHAFMVVVGYVDYDYMKVKILYNKESPDINGKSFEVSEKYFRHATKREVKASMPFNDVNKEVKKDPPMKKVWYKKWDAVIQELNDTVVAGGSVADFAVLYEDGSHNLYLDEPCIAELKRVGLRKTPQYVVLWCNSSKPLTKKWVKTLINHPAYSPYIKNKGVTDTLRRGLIVSADMPANLMGSLLILVRQVWEYEERVEMWDFLVRNGIDEYIAILFSNLGYLNENNNFYFCHHTDGHGPFSSDNFSMEAYGRFCNGDPVNLKKPFKEDQNYRGLWCLWNKDITDTFDDTEQPPLIDEADFPTKKKVKVETWDGFYFKTEIGKNTALKVFRKFEEQILGEIK